MKERSPRFPFTPLAEALEHLNQLQAATSEPPLSLEAAITALGYSGPNGAAVKVLAAMAGYGLINKRKNEVELTATGRAILEAPESDPEARLQLLRQAALSPPMFLRIWRRARHLNREDLEKRLLERGFTDGGAKRASEVYSANSELAQLKELDMEPDLPEVARRRAQKRRRDRRMEQRWASGELQSASPPTPQPPVLTLPLSKGNVRIPTGLSQEDFELLVRSLHLWKPRLIEGFEPKVESEGTIV